MADDSVIYPVGCKALGDNLGKDELLRRLKTLSTMLQSMNQDDEDLERYKPLALLLAEEHFLAHDSADVRLLVACCIADMLRVYAPDAPYRDADQVRAIFDFLADQLDGLRDPRSTAFKRHFYLLENLTYVKSFTMLMDFDDTPEIFNKLFAQMFKLVSDDHSDKVKNFIVDLLTPMVSDANCISLELLDIILINIVEPHKSNRKHANRLARDVISRARDPLSISIETLYQSGFVDDNLGKKYMVATKLYDLLYELNVFVPDVLRKVMPMVECKLQSTVEIDRLRAVSCLARMFSEKDSTMAKRYKGLFEIFMSRFNDVSVPIRIKCVQSSMHFLLNHATLRPHIIKALGSRQHDVDENVRFEVIMAIVSTSKRDCSIVSESDELLDYVKERTLDKKMKIRKEAMSGLGFIYKHYLAEDANVPPATRRAVVWIKNKILHGYYMASLDDRLLVERLLCTCLVPYTLPVVARMRTLFTLLATVDDNATKCYMEMQKNQLKIRRILAEWVHQHRIRQPTAAQQQELTMRSKAITKFLPDPLKAFEYVQRFSAHMRKESSLLQDMETILKPGVSCRACADAMSAVLKRLGQPIMTNLYHTTVKMLLERAASVLVDQESIGVLLQLVADCVQGHDRIVQLEETGNVGELGVKMLSVVSFVHSALFQTESTLRLMLGLLSLEESYVPLYVLKSFVYMGTSYPLAVHHADILEELLPTCKDFALHGTPEQAKYAIRCMYINMSPAEEGGVDSTADVNRQIVADLRDVLVEYRSSLSKSPSNNCACIVGTGHIAANLPDHFRADIKRITAKIVREVLLHWSPNEDMNKEDREKRERQMTRSWCERDELPNEMVCKIEALKMLPRWLFGLQDDLDAAQKTFRMLSVIVLNEVDVTQSSLMSLAELAYVRLYAGTTMLRICEVKGIGDQYTAAQFYALSTLMDDPVPQVREKFRQKLHKGLCRSIPNKCLPIDFLGVYALCGYETNPKLYASAVKLLSDDVNRRNEYLKTVTNDGKVSNGIIAFRPDYLIVYGIIVLTHNPKFNDCTSLVQLRKIERCMQMLYDVLFVRLDKFNYNTHTKLLQVIKNSTNAAEPDNQALNRKMYTICDVAQTLLAKRTLSVLEARMTAESLPLPSMHFIVLGFGGNNTDSYLPEDFELPANNTRKAGPRNNACDDIADEDDLSDAPASKRRRQKSSSNDDEDDDYASVFGEGDTNDLDDDDE